MKRVHEPLGASCFVQQTSLQESTQVTQQWCCVCRRTTRITRSLLFKGLSNQCTAILPNPETAQIRAAQQHFIKTFEIVTLPSKFANPTVRALYNVCALCLSIDMRPFAIGGSWIQNDDSVLMSQYLDFAAGTTCTFCIPNCEHLRDPLPQPPLHFSLLRCNQS